MSKRLSFIILYIWLALAASGQGMDTLSFVNIGVKDGLSNNAVTCLLQDHYGFMWMGTYDGLNRFDGRTFRIFRNQLQDSSSLINNHVTVIKEGLKDQIWVGTLKGFSRFDYRDFKFHKVYYQPYGTVKTAAIGARIRDVIADKSGQVMIATENYGLLVKDPVADLFQQIAYQGKAKWNVTAITAYTPGKYFVYLKDQGLFIYHRKTKTLTLFSSQLPGATRLLYEPLTHTLLIGTEDGLYRYQENTSRVTLFSSQLRHCNITHLLRDKNGVLWISTDGNGLAMLKAGGNPLKDIRMITQGHDQYHLESAAVYGVYEDNASRKWVATLRGGVSFLHAHAPLFTTIRKNEFDPHSLVSNFTLSFCEDKLNNVWIGTDGGGISYWNPRSNTFTNYVHEPDDPNSISGNYIVSILRDHKDRIWVASFNGGIDRKNPDGKGFIHYSCYNSFRKKYDKNLWKLYEDSHHHIWAGSTMGDALFLYNEERDQFQVFDNTLINIHTLYEDQKGDLWAGNYDQLIKIDTLHKKHTYIHVGFPVRAILQDGPDALWVGTEGGGLLIYQISTGQFQQYTDQEGLPSNTILNLLKDQEGRIWCSTYNGLSVLDAKTRRFTNYNINDGLQSNQFSYNAALALRDGSFLFGGINGFNRFYPDLIHKTIQPVTLRITDFLIDNQPIENTGYLKGGVTPVDFTTITIPYKDGSFAVHFAGLNYDAPKSVQYGYFLEGWDKDWTHAGNNPMATYSHLYEGSYRLHLAVMGPGGKPLPSTERVIALQILPPWFRSWWAYALYLLSISALIYGYQKYRQHQTRLLYEIKLTRLNANTERELNERKIAFFTNISHEFRTMLTLIINPIKELMAHGDEIGQPETIKTAYKNSRRMLSLIGQLLLFRKADSEATQLHITKVDLDCLCREVFESFAFQAKTNNIDYRMEVHSDGADDIKGDADTKQQPNGEDQEDLARELQISGADCGSMIIYGDAEKIEILLFNLLSNAFKYTPVGGKIYLKLAADDQNAEVWLSDSGKGIPMEEKDKIFMKFYQQNALDGRAKNGFGIGLFLVKDFITRHHATVDFTSAPGQGTVFHLRFQKGKAHFKGEVISESEEYDNGLAQEILESSSAASGGTDNGNVPGTGNDNVAAGSGPNSGRGVYAPNKVGTGAGISALVTEKKTLLIADDNAEIRNFVCRLFQENYHVVAAENGLKAIELMELRLPDLVILDLVMPGKYGDEICQLIKSTESWRHIPVIILTAEASTEIKLRCVESGADDYITKPFEQELLIARVNNLLNTKSNLQKYFYNEITLQENSQKVSAEDKAFLDQCMAIIEDHIDDDQFEIKVLADKMCMSHSSLYKKIHYSTGYSVTGFIRFVRLRKAAEIFVNTRSNVNETAFMVGFSDVKYFRSQFQKLFEMTPSAYIKKFRKPFEKSFSRKNQMGD